MAPPHTPRRLRQQYQCWYRAYQTRLEAVEREVLRDALQAHGGKKRAAAHALGMALSTFYTKLKKYSL